MHGRDIAQIAGSGPLILAIGVAAFAGLVSFFAPCMLPLVPGYLSYVTGLGGAGLDAAAGRLGPASADGNVWTDFTIWLRVTVGPGQICI